MTRNIRPYEPTWLDKAFRKSYKKLSQKKQDGFMARLKELMEALKICSHPITDATVRRWKPSRYKAGREKGYYVEYRFPGATRVIVYFEIAPDQVVGTATMMVATVNHNHRRMELLIRMHDPTGCN